MTRLIFGLLLAGQFLLIGGVIAKWARSSHGRSWWTVQSLTRDLRKAVLRNEIVPHYQPIVRAVDGVRVGFEALARWNHPRHGVLAAGRFLDLAEAKGYMAVIDRRMLLTVARDLPALMERLDAAADPFVTVNLSPRRLAQPGYAQEILDLLTGEGLSGDGLVIEMTEASKVLSWPSFLDNVARFQDSGIGLAIDDFGSGQANLVLLSKLDVDIVKLDRSVVELAIASAGASAVLRGAIAAVRASGALIVAEGASDITWVTQLGLMGVDFVQGFGIGYPRSIDDLAGDAPSAPGRT